MKPLEETVVDVEEEESRLMGTLSGRVDVERSPYSPRTRDYCRGRRNQRGRQRLENVLDTFVKGYNFI